MTATDAGAVADLHTVSWRSAYRGVFSDEWLDAHADADRAAHWARRLAVPLDTAAGLVASHDGVLVGFAYLIADAEPTRGTLLDNLHVVPDRRGGGVGRRLLGAVVTLAVARSWPAGLHLWVFEANTGARRFYARHGGQVVGRILYAAADGGAHPSLCYHWDSDAAARLTTWPSTAPSRGASARPAPHSRDGP